MPEYSPQFVVDDNEAPVLRQGECSDQSFAKLNPLRILIAEDNYVNRRLLLTVFANLGYEAMAVEDGSGCLEAVARFPFDLLLTDLNMPGMTGLECAERLREAGHLFSIVAVTASAPEFTREECLAAGMTDYIRKPICVTDLKRILRETALRKWLLSVNDKYKVSGFYCDAALAA